MKVNGREYNIKPGLEGPLLFKGNRVLYWDRREGTYYDPDTDLYLSQEQADNLTRTFGDIISHARLLGWRDNNDDFDYFFTDEFEQEIKSYINHNTTTPQG